MARRQQVGSSLLLAALLHACEYDDARHAQRPRLVVRHPASSDNEAPPSEPAPSAPQPAESPLLVQLRAQTRPHVAVALGAEWFVGSSLLVPLPAISLDVGAQIRDVFAVYAMTRVASLVALNAFELGPAFEWAPLDVLSFGAGATAVVTHWRHGIDYCGISRGVSRRAERRHPHDEPAQHRARQLSNLDRAHADDRPGLLASASLESRCRPGLLASVIASPA